MINLLNFLEPIQLNTQSNIMTWTLEPSGLFICIISKPNGNPRYKAKEFWKSPLPS